MIKKVRVCNYKCYGQRGADFNLSRINFIFGDNSSGKSTFLQFLKKIDEICDLDGKCGRSELDKHLFKNQPGSVSAKIRIEQRIADDVVEEVWNFGLSKANVDEYELTDLNWRPIGRERLSAVLSSDNGDRIVHVAANRAEGSQSSKESNGFARLEEQIDIAESENTREYVNDILKRLGVPYSCVVDERTNQVSSAAIRDNEFSIELPLNEVGTGIDGLFRLALTLHRWRGGILEIEEPETNVGEEQMAALAKVLSEEALKRDGGQLIVECHSKIMAIQLVELVKEQVLTCGNTPDANLSVMVVEKTPHGSVVDNVSIDRNGDVSWPKGFFPAEGKLLRQSYRIS